MSSVNFFDFNRYFMEQSCAGVRNEKDEYVNYGIGVFDKGEYFDVKEWDEWQEELKKQLGECGAKIGDIVFVPFAERIENCYGVVLENFEVSFGECGWSAPYECKKSVKILKDHNIKYKDFYLKMRGNKNHGEFFFLYETDTMVDEMKAAGLWD